MRTVLFWATRCVVAQKSAVLVQNVFSGMKRKFRLREEERKLRLKSGDYNLNCHLCETLKVL
jgi:protein-S-isoprenylcysteine O-methyltransferase Ste14